MYFKVYGVNLTNPICHKPKRDILDRNPDNDDKFFGLNGRSTYVLCVLPESILIRFGMVFSIRVLYANDHGSPSFADRFNIGHL
jgi:hypothetical protein